MLPITIAVGRKVQQSLRETSKKMTFPDSCCDDSEKAFFVYRSVNAHRWCSSCGGREGFSDEEAASSKRKWGNNKARMWGKREDTTEKRGWGQKNKSRLWGKRMDVDELSRMIQDGQISPDRVSEFQDKRKWAKNKARMWGK